MGISFGVIGEMPPWCLNYKCCKIKQPDSFWSSCALFCIRGTEETCSGWKSLLRRRMEHQAIFKYKLRNSHFYCLIPVSFNCDFHDYYTRSTNDILKSSATRRWGHWSSVNFNSSIWNCVDTSLKCGLSKAILWYVYVHLYVFNQIYMWMWIFFSLIFFFIVLHFLTSV